MRLRRGARDTVLSALRFVCFEKGGLMARTVYRSLTSKRRTSIPRASSTSAGMATSFARMLSKLAFAQDSLSRARRRR